MSCHCKQVEGKFQRKALLFLAYQSLGYLFGGLSTSPLYVYQSIFSGRLKHVQNEDAIFGAFSLIFWTLSLFSLLKYAIIMLNADDNGEGKGYFLNDYSLSLDPPFFPFLLFLSPRNFYLMSVGVLTHSTCAGGTIALYSHLCRNAKFCLLPNHQASDEELSTYHKPGCSNRNVPPSPLKRFVEKHKRSKPALLLFVLLGACMVICVGALMPAISGKGTFFLLPNMLVCLVEFVLVHLLVCHVVFFNHLLAL